jgi:hypothetical protein
MDANLGQLLSLRDAEFSRRDVVVINLAVAKGIPTLESLDIDHYVRLADQWASDLRTRMSRAERQYYDAPADWGNDLDLFRLGLICWYCDRVLRISYREDQKDATQILYTNPSDLFLNGVMDTRQGTCGNLALLHVVLGRRIGLPVSLACAGSHFLCRFDDGEKTINIETTEAGRGGFSSQTDEYLLNKHRLPAKAKTCGSDLRAVTPREMLGLFLGARARHLENTGRLEEAERDYLLARFLFPRNRALYVAQNQVSVQRSMGLFEADEPVHPIEVADWLRRLVCVTGCAPKQIEDSNEPKEDLEWQPC